MRSHSIRSGLILILCAIPLACDSSNSISYPDSAKRAAPRIDGDDLTGKRFKLSDFRGKVVLLDFWATY
jgi:cytochrome oxidase Cu insertion factor (SCO1/SenC/PrrC family)